MSTMFSITELGKAAKIASELEPLFSHISMSCMDTKPQISVQVHTQDELTRALNIMAEWGYRSWKIEKTTGPNEKFLWWELGCENVRLYALQFDPTDLLAEWMEENWDPFEAPDHVTR